MDDWTETKIHVASNDVWGGSVSKAVPEDNQRFTDCLNTKMASRNLYNQKQVKIRVYPLGKRKYVLPRKVT
jgi:hypothetical protein